VRDNVDRAAGERPLGARRRRFLAGNRAWRFIAARSSNRDPWRSDNPRPNYAGDRPWVQLLRAAAATGQEPRAISRRADTDASQLYDRRQREVNSPHATLVRAVPACGDGGRSEQAGSLATSLDGLRRRYARDEQPPANRGCWALQAPHTSRKSAIGAGSSGRRPRTSGTQ